MKSLSLFTLFCLATIFTLTNCSFSPSPEIEDTSQESEEEQLKSLVQKMYIWQQAKEERSVDFDVKGNEIKYTEIDKKALDAKLKTLKESNFFTQNYLDNYTRISNEIDKRLKDGFYEYFVGDLPPFLVAEVNPWCTCQDNPDKFWETMVFNNIKIESNKASLDWTWGDASVDSDFLYHVDFVKVDNQWKIDYLEGFDFEKYFGLEENKV